MANGEKETPSVGVVHKLAQNETAVLGNGLAIVQGDGSKFPGWEPFRAKTKRKIISQVLSVNLAAVAETNNQPEQAKSYWNTYHCQERLISQNGVFFGKYCKNKFCPLCLNIRKARIINDYLPVIQDWKEPYFLTLTVKSVPKRLLNKRLKDMNRAFRLIKDKYRKRHQRGKGPILRGIKSLECNFNPLSKTYNPHFHLLVPDKETGEIILREWLSLWTDKFAIKAAQKLVKVYSRRTALIEIVKYGCKIFTEPSLKKTGEKKGKGQRDIYIAALDNIFQGMNGLRVFERFGFNLPAKPKKENKTRVISDFKEWEFAPEVYDWINVENGKRLSGYILNADLEFLLFNRLNITDT